MSTMENARLGVRLEIRKTAEDTDGALFEFDVVGRARGLLTQTHVHTAQTERHEVIEGSLRLVIEGREHLLQQGEAMTVPIGAEHRQVPGPGDVGPGRVRVQLRPAGDSEAFVRRLVGMDVNRLGLPRSLGAATLVRDFGHMGHAARPPLPVQRALSRAILAVASREYEFVDEWDVAAPREAVFAAIADARTYPQWWKPVYIEVDAEGEPALGKESRQHFKGRLPYHLHTRSRIVALDAPHVIEGPALRWNHNWAIARAVEGLEPYARARSTAT